MEDRSGIYFADVNVVQEQQYFLPHIADAPRGTMVVRLRPIIVLLGASARTMVLGASARTVVGLIRRGLGAAVFSSREGDL